MTSLVTPRLRGQPLAETDLDVLCELHGDRRVTRGEPLTVDEAQQWLERKLAHWREHGFGVWMFHDADGRFVGRCGIHRWSLDGRPEVELGYVVRPELWSQGFATEMARAVAAHAFSSLRLPDLVGFTLPENVASRRVLQKAGFTYERDFVGATGATTVLYRRTAGGRAAS